MSCYYATTMCGKSAGISLRNSAAIAGDFPAVPQYLIFKHTSRSKFSSTSNLMAASNNNGKISIPIPIGPYKVLLNSLNANQWQASHFFGSTTKHDSRSSDEKGSNEKQSPLVKTSVQTEESETHGQPLHRFGSSVKLEQAASRFDLHQYVENPQSSKSNKYHVDVASEHHADVYNHMTSVNLAACMQSQVPEPYGKTPSHMNMPGGIARREDKYIQGRLSDMTGKREFSTAALRHSHHQYDEHGNPTYQSLERIMSSPCVQGIQGEDCEQFKLWLSNCLQHGDLQECEVLANEYIAGRKTLAQLFLEYDLEIRRVSTSRHDYIGGSTAGPKVVASSASSDASGANSAKPANEENEAGKTDEGADVGKPSRAARLKAAVRDYGSTVIVFHVGISLASLGLCYTLVASNVDVTSVLTYFNISLGSAQSSVSTASTFAVAYAVHKVFAPVRIATTLTCAPLIVRALRARGILKAPKPKVSPPPS